MRVVSKCRLDECQGIAVLPSTMCYEHIVRGRAAFSLYRGDTTSLDIVTLKPSGRVNDPGWPGLPLTRWRRFVGWLRYLLGLCR